MQPLKNKETILVSGRYVIEDTIFPPSPEILTLSKTKTMEVV